MNYLVIKRRFKTFGIFVSMYHLLKMFDGLGAAGGHIYVSAFVCVCIEQ